MKFRRWQISFAIGAPLRFNAGRIRDGRTAASSCWLAIVGAGSPHRLATTASRAATLRQMGSRRERIQWQQRAARTLANPGRFEFGGDRIQGFLAISRRGNRDHPRHPVPAIFLGGRGPSFSSFGVRALSCGHDIYLSTQVHSPASRIHVFNPLSCLAAPLCQSASKETFATASDGAGDSRRWPGASKFPGNTGNKYQSLETHMEQSGRPLPEIAGRPHISHPSWGTRQRKCAGVESRPGSEPRFRDATSRRSNSAPSATRATTGADTLE